MNCLKLYSVEGFHLPLLFRVTIECDCNMAVKYSWPAPTCVLTTSKLWSRYFVFFQLVIRSLHEKLQIQFWRDLGDSFMKFLLNMFRANPEFIVFIIKIFIIYLSNFMIRWIWWCKGDGGHFWWHNHLVFHSQPLNLCWDSWVW